MIVKKREREAETQAEGEAGSRHREPDVGFDPRSPGSRPGPKAGAKPLRHPGIPNLNFLNPIPSMDNYKVITYFCSDMKALSTLPHLTKQYGLWFIVS